MDCAKDVLLHEVFLKFSSLAIFYINGVVKWNDTSGNIGEYFLDMLVVYVIAKIFCVSDSFCYYGLIICSVVNNFGNWRQRICTIFFKEFNGVLE